MKKWCVVIHASDGTHTSIFLGQEGAFKTFEYQLGYEVDTPTVLDSIEKKGNYSVTDKTGRVLELTYRLVGTCRICKKSNKPLQRIEIMGGTSVKTCDACYSGYSCGNWSVLVKNGKSRIIRNY